MQTLNFSAGGFYCHVDRKIEPLTRLGLRFVFPPFGPEYSAERSIECEAVVVRCEKGAEGYRIAACFTEISAADRQYIDEYLRWYETVYGNPPEEADTLHEGLDDWESDVA